MTDLITVFDTETTNLVNHKKPHDDPSQPGLIQLAAISYDGDLRPLFKLSMLVNCGKPSGKYALEAHGIPDATVSRLGLPVQVAVGMFDALMQRSRRAVAHNAQFDVKMMNVAAASVGKTISWPIVIDTMVEAHEIVKAPPTAKMLAAGFTGYKKPNLSECIKFFFNEELSGAHDAMVDTEACARVYFELVRRNSI